MNLTKLVIASEHALGDVDAGSSTAEENDKDAGAADSASRLLRWCLKHLLVAETEEVDKDGASFATALLQESEQHFHKTIQSVVGATREADDVTVCESFHPFVTECKYTNYVRHAGVSAVRVVFDSECKLPASGSSQLTFYLDKAHSKILVQYNGKQEFKPFIAHCDTLYYSFHARRDSMASGKENWGYRFEVCDECQFFEFIYSV